MLLFSTDIDGTIYDGADTAQRFRSFWEEVRRLDPSPLLSYNTGRSRDDTFRLIEDTSLPRPDFLISGVGTHIHDCQSERDLSEWTEELGDGWDFDRIEAIVREGFDDIEMQPADCQNPYKCSWFWLEKSREDIEAMAGLLADADLEAQIVYSSRRDLDILPRRANKGNAISWLVEFLGIPASRVAVAGDSGNDASMFLVDDVYGIIVSNAEGSLPAAAAGANIFHSTLPCVDGVIEGLSRHLELDRRSVP